MNLPQNYIDKIQQRSQWHYLKGLLVRVYFYIKTSLCRRWAILHGAKIGTGTVLSWHIAKLANENLTVGNDSIIDADNLDLRGKITIGNHVIINNEVNIIRVSHYIDNDHVFTTKPYPELIIDDYCWLATGAKVLPQVTKIARGSVAGAYSVIVKNTEEMGVYGGNPASMLKKHSTVYDELVVCSLQGCDFPFYLKARNLKNNI